jgi:hypothetical protein
MLQKDLENNDFILVIKYLSINSNVESSKHALDILVSNVNLIDDVLYRELFRLSLNQLASSLAKNYKNGVYFLNNFFKKMMNKYLTSSERI